MKRTIAAVAGLREPPALNPGSRIALIAPAGPVGGMEPVERAKVNVASLGWNPVLSPHALHEEGYFAGSDQQRAKDLSAAIADPAIDGIWCLRGGYGAMRLLDLVDFSPLIAAPKALIGYSDITALHSAWNRLGLVSYHGPVARAELTPLSRTSLQQAATERADSAGDATNAIVVRGGKATGRLAGGNLALVAALCGTPWAVNFRGAIAILEDLNEATYRLDRMLTQLRLAGAFDGCRGIVFGHFTDCADTSDQGRRSLDDILMEVATTLGVPAISGAPLGHIADQWTYPLGALATLDADVRRLSVLRGSVGVPVHTDAPLLLTSTPL